MLKSSTEIPTGVTVTININETVQKKSKRRIPKVIERIQTPPVVSVKSPLKSPGESAVLESPSLKASSCVSVQGCLDSPVVRGQDRCVACGVSTEPPSRHCCNCGWLLR